MKQGKFPAIFNLADLNGKNGFKLDGENPADSPVNVNFHVSHFVNMAGDINSDGHADLIIGASGYPGGGNKGRSYVVFGGHGIGDSGIIALSSLNGSNGFKLDGENNNDYSGWSVSAAGDINNDGYADLIDWSMGLSGWWQ